MTHTYRSYTQFFICLTSSPRPPAAPFISAHRSGLADAKGKPLHPGKKVKKSKTNSKKILSKPPPAGRVIVGGVIKRSPPPSSKSGNSGGKSGGKHHLHRSLLAKGYDASGNSGSGKLSQVCTSNSRHGGVGRWRGHMCLYIVPCIGGQQAGCCS